MLTRSFMRINAGIRATLFSNRWLVQQLFRTRLVASPTIQSYCEWPTLLQRLVLPRYMGPSRRVLEIGTGAHAILAVYLKRAFPGTQLTLTEIVPERAEAARLTLAANGVDATCVESDLFEHITGAFDLILFSPPMHPSSALSAMGYTPKTLATGATRLCWSSDGGVDGMEVIRRFLDRAGHYLEPEGRILMATNTRHVVVAHLLTAIEAAQLKLDRIHRLAGIYSIYVLKLAENGTAESPVQNPNQAP